MGCTGPTRTRARSGRHECPEHRRRVRRGPPRRLPDGGEEREAAAARRRGGALGLPPGAPGPGRAAQVHARVAGRDARATARSSRSPSPSPRSPAKDDRRQRRPRLRAAPARRVHRALAPREEGHARVGGGRRPVEPARPGRAGADRRCRSRSSGPGPASSPSPSSTPGRSTRGSASARSFAAAVPPLPLVELWGSSPTPASDAVTVFDKQTRQVGGGAGRRARPARARGRPAPGAALRGPLRGRRGGRLRPRHRRGAGAGPPPARRPAPGTGRSPPTGARSWSRTPGSNTVAFVDSLALVEVGRAGPGSSPRRSLMDRAGRRAYAFNQGSSNITILDVAGAGRGRHHPHRRGAGPGRPQPDRRPACTWSRPIVGLHERAVRSRRLARVNQIYVGFNAVSVHVDPRTDYVYVCMGDAGQLQLFAPLTPLPVGRVDLPGPATWLAIDDAYDVLLCVIPSRQPASPPWTSRAGRCCRMLDAGRCALRRGRGRGAPLRRRDAAGLRHSEGARASSPSWRALAAARGARRRHRRHRRGELHERHPHPHRRHRAVHHRSTRSSSRSATGSPSTSSSTRSSS